MEAAQGVATPRLAAGDGLQLVQDVAGESGAVLASVLHGDPIDPWRVSEKVHKTLQLFSKVHALLVVTFQTRQIIDSIVTFQNPNTSSEGTIGSLLGVLENVCLHLALIMSQFCVANMAYMKHVGTRNFSGCLVEIGEDDIVSTNKG